MENSDFLNKLGERIIKIRQEKGIRQVDLSFKSGIDDGSLRKIERGEVNITTKTILKIADALEIDVKDLFDFEK